MNFSTMTVSYPIDEQTYEEIEALCERAEQTDLKNYKLVLNLQMARSYEAKGFFVLVYNDDEDILVGVASAVDTMGLNTYEWSILVDPMYRQIGIGSALKHVLNEGLEVRGSEGDLALTIDGGHYGVPFLLKNHYHYSFSEATLESKAERTEEVLPFIVRPFELRDTQDLCTIFSQGFGDTEDESLQLIEFNSLTEGIHLWVAERDGKVIGTVSTRKEGEGHWLTALAVHPGYEGQGIGSQLIRWVKDYVARQHDHYVLLDVEIENERALSIYLKNGFMVASQIHYFVRGL